LKSPHALFVAESALIISHEAGELSLAGCFRADDHGIDFAMAFGLSEVETQGSIGRRMKALVLGGVDAGLRRGELVPGRVNVAWAESAWANSSWANSS
jgi:hypothetical protein